MMANKTKKKRTRGKELSKEAKVKRLMGHFKAARRLLKYCEEVQGFSGLTKASLKRVYMVIASNLIVAIDEVHPGLREQLRKEHHEKSM